ncbi:uncharacterized protein LOC142019284 [Carettochelys insculpta]|uniref:uncharacterized protein LOC142019284 n=1 Tax=Carettochelys insculpta TaxID=44489 RepID=UPI003EBAFA06
MSWPGEAWQEGLPAQALQGVRELEQRLEWATKERGQKQAQLDALEAALHKQRQKHEEERGTWALLARERRELAEACERLERECQQLRRELQAKGVQLSQLEGQLARAAQHSEELEEELRRCQAELENLRPMSPAPPHCRALRGEGAEMGTWGQTPQLKNRPPTPSMRPGSLLVGEGQSLHCQGAWHSAPPGGPAPPEDSQGSPSPGEEPAEEKAGLGRDTETRGSRGELPSLQQELAQRTEQRDQAVAKVSALQGRVQQLLEELRGQRQRAGATQRRLEQKERLHQQELAELERRHREELEQGEGQRGVEGRPPGCGRRSLSTSRLERAPGKRGAAGKGRGPSAQGPRAMGPTERGQEPGAPAELLALRSEVLELRRHLAASDSLWQGLQETCWQLRHGPRDEAEERRALAEMPPAPEAAVQHKEEEAQKLPGGPEAGQAQGELAELQALVIEGQALGGDLQVLRGEMRALALGKAEAEAQAAQAQERLRRLQETLGLQTERLALACEAQTQHVAELLTEAHEREQELERLGQALREARQARGQLEAEVVRLRALLGRKTPPSGTHELPTTVPEPGSSELLPAAPWPSRHEPLPGNSLAEPPAAGPLEPPPTAPWPSPPEMSPSVPGSSPPELPLAIPEPLTTVPSELPSTPPGLPSPLELPRPDLEMAVARKMQDPSMHLPLLVGQPAGHSERAQLQSSLWELQKPAGQAGLQGQPLQPDELLCRLRQENQALRAELALGQSQGPEERAAPISGDGPDQGTSATPPAASLRDRSQGDLAYVLQTPWPGVRDTQTQTEGPVWGRRRGELISAALDHTQYEPYGLPEVVVKGFADIPSGPSCPYVLRRGTLGSTSLVQLMPRPEPEEDSAEPDKGTSV